MLGNVLTFGLGCQLGATVRDELLLLRPRTPFLQSISFTIWGGLFVSAGMYTPSNFETMTILSSGFSVPAGVTLHLPTPGMRRPVSLNQVSDATPRATASEIAKNLTSFCVV